MTEKKQFNSDDQDWLDVLGGWDINNVDETTRAEAEALRKVLISDDENKNDELKTKRAENALLKKLKDEGLIKSNKSYFNTFSLASVAASVVVVSIALSVVIDTGSRNNLSEDEQALNILGQDSPTQAFLISEFNLEKENLISRIGSVKSEENISKDAFKILKFELMLLDIEYSVIKEERGYRIIFGSQHINSKALKELLATYNFKTNDSGVSELLINYE